MKEGMPEDSPSVIIVAAPPAPSLEPYTIIVSAGIRDTLQVGSNPDGKGENGQGGNDQNVTKEERDRQESDRCQQRGKEMVKARNARDRRKRRFGL